MALSLDGRSSRMFVLSIREPWAGLIVSGTKLWEFRANPRFGTSGSHQLMVGDMLFIVAMGHESACIAGQARVMRILREPHMSQEFGNAETGLWLEAGGEYVDHASFAKDILGNYHCAIKLAAAPLAERVPVGRVRRKSGKAWNGKGFNHVDSLHRYQVDGMGLGTFLSQLAAIPYGQGRER